MSFKEDEIATMLKEFLNENNLNLYIYKLSKEIYNFTSGYLFLVSRICQIIVDKLVGVYSNTKSYIGWDNETFVPTKVIFDFLAIKVSGELRGSEESTEVGWFSKEVVLDMIQETWIKERAKDMMNFNGQVVYRVYSSRPYEVYRDEYI